MAKKNSRGDLKVIDGIVEISVEINGACQAMRVAAAETLLNALRREGYKGAKKGCGNGDCGACTILLDGKPVRSCLLFAAQAHGRKIVTIEGLGTPTDPHPIQKAFAESGAVQCGYCIPGMVLVTKALLDETPEPDEPTIRRALDGNLCRCTGYVKQVEAVNLSARRLKAAGRGK